MSAHRVLHDMFRAPYVVTSTTDAESLSNGSKNLQQFAVTTAAPETRTLPVPTKAGVMCAVCLDADGGNLTLTVTSGYNADGDTAIVFGDAGDFVLFYAVEIGSVYRWRILAHEGTDLAVETLNVDAITTNEIVIAAESAEHGAGAIGTGATPTTYRYTQSGTIITEIKVDLTGLASVATANDVIGLSAGGNAYIGKNVVATNGIIYKIELICLEATVGGDDDVNVVVNSSGTLAYDGAGGTTYGVNGGDAAAGQVVENLVQGLTADHYFYLTAGTGDTAAAYTAGQFIVRLHGHALLT